MKKLFIILFYLTNIIWTTTGQPYKSLFGSAQTSWNVAFHIMPDWTLTDSLVVCNDTMINGHIYKYVKDYGTSGFDGYLREDTMTGKAWYLDNSWLKNEFLIMDLSLNVGDTFIIHQESFPEDSIAIVDSIKYVGGNKVIFLSKCGYGILLGSECLSFIEGIGPNAGIIFQLYQSSNYFAEGSLLLCSHKDNVQVYSNSSPYFYGKCYVHYGGIKENPAAYLKLSIYPNPSGDKIHIEYNGPRPYTIQIYDYSGKCISSKTDINSSPFDFDMIEYPHGIYLLKVKGNDGKYATGKFLKL